MAVICYSKGIKCSSQYSVAALTWASPAFSQAVAPSVPVRLCQHLIKRELSGLRLVLFRGLPSCRTISPKEGCQHALESLCLSDPLPVHEHHMLDFQRTCHWLRSFQQLVCWTSA